MRYARLLEGLDATEIRLSGLERTKRVDAEFFSKRHLRVATLMAKTRKECIQKLAVISDGNHFAISDDFTDEGVPYYRGQDVVVNVFVEQAAPRFITSRAFQANHMKRSHLEKGDVLLSIVGTIGEASLVTSETPATCSCKLAILRPRSISPEYLTAFLRSEMGRSQTDRFTRGAVQMGLLLEDMDQLFVARFSESFEKRVVKVVQEARRQFDVAAASLSKAENSISGALGLLQWQPPKPLSYTRMASEVFAARRMDSQYFAPRVAELLSRLSSAGRSIRDAASPRQEKFASSGSGTFRYIEIGDVGSDGTANYRVVPMREAPSRATWYVKAGDVLTSTVRPNRRLSVLVTPEQDGCVASSGFVVLRPQAVPAEVLLTYLRLPVFCELMDLHTSASLYPAISDRDLLALPFPIIDSAASQGIVVAVRSAHVARQRAHQLLARAKKAVEIAIEHSEKSALAYLEGKVN